MSASPRRRRVRVLLLRVGLALVATSALAELGCRTLVYAGWCSSWTLAQKLRDPKRFGRYQADDAYWEMKARLTPASQLRDDKACWDPVLGWTSGPVHPGDGAHDDETCLGGRRPILLFGDSYAFGVPLLTVGTFARWTEESDLGTQWRLLNYGCGGYGLDQISLLLKRAVERQLSRRPVVMVSFLVDDDLDRCLLELREWPKPRFELRDGELVLEQEKLPTLGEYLESRTSLGPSVFLDLLHGTYVRKHWPRGSPHQEQRKRELARAILADTVEFLRERDVPFFFVLFQHVSSVVDPTVSDWREPFATATLDELEVPWVSMRSALLEHARRTGRSMHEYYVEGGGHLNVLGNHIAFQVLREGLHELLGICQGGNLDEPLDAELDLASLPAGARPPWLPLDASPLVASGLEPPFAVFDPSGGQRAGGAWTLIGGQRELSARAALLAQPRGSAVTCQVVIEVDGAQRAELTVHSGAPPQDLHIDLSGAREFRIRTELEPSDAAVAQLVLDRFTVVPDLSVARRPPPLR